MLSIKLFRTIKNNAEWGKTKRIFLSRAYFCYLHHEKVGINFGHLDSAYAFNSNRLACNIYEVVSNDLTH